MIVGGWSSDDGMGSGAGVLLSFDGSRGGDVIPPPPFALMLDRSLFGDSWRLLLVDRSDTPSGRFHTMRILQCLELLCVSLEIDELDGQGSLQ